MILFILKINIKSYLKVSASFFSGDIGSGTRNVDFFVISSWTKDKIKLN
jgi:hypothetical protein